MLQRHIRLLSTKGARRSAYRGHLPTSPLQKIVAAGASAALSLADPARADMVGLLGEATGRVNLRRGVCLMARPRRASRREILGRKRARRDLG